MARIPEQEITRLKQEISLQRLAESAKKSMGSGSIENQTTSILFPKKTFLQIAVFILLPDLKPFLPPFLRDKDQSASCPQ